MVRVIAVSSGKGGTGKSVTTANLGALLASEFKQNVLAVDCNLTNPHLGLYLGTLTSWPITLNHVLRGQATIQQAMHTHHSGLKVIPASFQSHEVARFTFKRLRSGLRQAFSQANADIVLLDSPPGISLDSLMTLRCSDEVMFVATPHIPSIVDIAKCVQLLQSTDARPLGIILNRVRGKQYEMGANEISRFTGLPILGQVPEDDRVLEATNFKAPVVLTHPQAPASQAFRRLAAFLIGEQVPAPERWGWFARWFSKT